eukprot:755648-Amphidinium_carterae.1
MTMHCTTLFARSSSFDDRPLVTLAEWRVGTGLLLLSCGQKWMWKVLQLLLAVHADSALCYHRQKLRHSTEHARDLRAQCVLRLDMFGLKQSRCDSCDSVHALGLCATNGRFLEVLFNPYLCLL